MKALLRAGLGLALVLMAGACAKSSTDAYSSSAPTASVAPSASTPAAAVATATNAKLGKILVDGSGKTLYFFDRDANGTIACVDACATKWPPLLTTGAPNASGITGLGTAKRPDGSTQVTYHTHPLYRYSLDTKAGDTNGDGFAGVWHAAKVTSG